ncbi:hypothetical protein A3C96_03530 [Candidatus Uhrbacteria bacterium RIFCSPHIGHO2_02_FULL_60_10]|uniref:Uncharacterized protein n=1 Tax=Candidatus Uhrbacteria bacterium RIFCSPHIGHO2_02_FULL_60_10 TaxID=1802392 RepID=A0A1F7U7C9_9BACT|nr:MAG: hypothetical protein A3C96_03530 [Candidatus Uhrbacteria bacterium RIFCSPHIGHO2_02_FULL_60_10]
MPDSDSLRARLWRGAKKKARESRHRSGGLYGLVLFLFLALLALLGSYGWFTEISAGKIASGLHIAGVDVGDKEPAEAKKLVQAALEGYRLNFLADGRPLALPATKPTPNQDRPIVRFDVESAVQTAYEFGREPAFMTAAAKRFRALIDNADIGVPAAVNPEALAERLRAEFGSDLTPPRNAYLKIRIEASGTPMVSAVEERIGQRIDYESAVQDATQRANRLSAAPIRIAVEKIRPDIVQADAEQVMEGVAAAIARAPVTMTVRGRTWGLSRQVLADWLDAVLDDQGRIRLGINWDMANRYLADRGQDLRREPKNAVFEMLDGKVVKFETSESGEELDTAGAIKLIEAFVLGQPGADGQAIAEPLKLPMKEVPPEVDTAASNPFGIHEIIGVGESSFRGSPKNRRTNIATGAKSLDGIIVMPGEEFSTLNALGPIDGEHGYLEELVIKGNKTTPEFGGGLCQIGTTTFRMALASGLPITERRNHSYRVSYYERAGDGSYMGPGKDATIYNPSPDFKFLNDTGHAILIRTAIKTNRLTFTLWGVSDGRKSEQTDAKVSNIKPPPEKKLIETTELPPGQTKCTETPHEGADAFFTYTVTYPDGREVKKDFFSRYRPWGEVCLVGVDPNAPKAPAAGLPSEDTAGVRGE